MNISKTIRSIPNLEECTYALPEQLSLLHDAAKRLGLNKAADFIKPYRCNVSNIPPKAFAFPLHKQHYLNQESPYNLNP